MAAMRRLENPLRLWNQASLVNKRLAGRRESEHEDYDRRQEKYNKDTFKFIKLDGPCTTSEEDAP